MAVSSWEMRNDNYYMYNGSSKSLLEPIEVGEKLVFESLEKEN